MSHVTIVTQLHTILVLQQIWTQIAQIPTKVRMSTEIFLVDVVT